MINNSQTYMYYMAGLEKAVIVRNRMRDGLAVQRFTVNLVCCTAQELSQEPLVVQQKNK